MIEPEATNLPPAHSTTARVEKATNVMLGTKSRAHSGSAVCQVIGLDDLGVVVGDEAGFGIEPLHHSHRGDRLVGERVRNGELVLIGARELAQASPEEDRSHHDEGDEGQDTQRQHRADEDDQHHTSGEGDRLGQRTPDGIRDHRLHDRCVRCEAGGDVTGALAVEERHREPNDAVEEGPPDVGDDAFSDD